VSRYEPAHVLRVDEGDWGVAFTNHRRVAIFNAEDPGWRGEPWARCDVAVCSPWENGVHCWTSEDTADA
jgi:hypothetical protein